MDSDFIIKKEYFLRVKREPFEKHYFIHPQKLGTGSMGCVYRVRTKDPPTWRAAKSINKKDIDNENELLHQINILKSLDHPNIIKMYEIYQDDKHIFIVQDLCEGGELFQKLMKADKFTEVDARRIFRQLVEAVYYCHNHHVAHRDLKPQNILFLKSDSLDLKIIDFGVSFAWQKSMSDELTLKCKKNFVGTPYYVAPQILVSPEKYDQRCDIWSLGVILYILLTSIPPFDGDTAPEIFQKIKKYDYSLNIPEMKGLSSFVKDLIKKILVPPSQRITIENIMKHPWMTCEPNPIMIKPNIKSLANFSKFTKTKKIAAEFIASQLQPAEVEQLTNMFRQLDLNKDGEISMQELKQCLNKEGLGYAELRRIMDSIDTDHNGKINYTEFLASASGNNLFDEKNIKRAFNMLDIDGNGFVQREELKQLFKESGMGSYKSRTIDQIMEECDKDGNGMIDFEEFRSCLLKK